MLGLVAAAVGFFAVTLAALLAVALAVRAVRGHLEVDTDSISAPLLLATNLGLASCIPLAGLLTWGIYGLRPRWLASVAPGLRWSWLRSCLVVASVVWGVLFLLALTAVATTAEARFDGKVAALLVVVLLTTPLQAAGEEYLFRGFLLQSLGATGLRAPPCWVISGALFATAHGQFAPALFADRWLIGIVFAWLATATGGLEASITIHAVKNVSALVPAVLLGELSSAIDPSDVTWLPFALDAVMLTVAALWIRTRLRRHTLPPPPPEVWPEGPRAG